MQRWSTVQLLVVSHGGAAAGTEGETIWKPIRVKQPVVFIRLQVLLLMI